MDMRGGMPLQRASRPSLPSCLRGFGRTFTEQPVPSQCIIPQTRGTSNVKHGGALVPGAASKQAVPVSIERRPSPRRQPARETASAHAAPSETHIAQTTAAAAVAAAEPLDVLLQRAARLKAQARRHTEDSTAVSQFSTGASTSGIEIHDEQQGPILQVRQASPMRLTSPGFLASEDSTAASDFGSAVVAIATGMPDERAANHMEDGQDVTFQQINHFSGIEASEDATGQHEFSGASADSVPETTNELLASINVSPPETQTGLVSEMSSPFTTVQDELEITMTRWPSLETLGVSPSDTPLPSHHVVAQAATLTPAVGSSRHHSVKAVDWASSVTTALSTPGIPSSPEIGSLSRANTDDLMQAGQLHTLPQPLMVDGDMVSDWAEPFMAEQAPQPAVHIIVRMEDAAEHSPSFEQAPAVLECFADVNEADQLGPSHLPTPPVMVSPRMGQGPAEERESRKLVEAEQNAVIHPEAETCTSLVVDMSSPSSGGQAKEWHIWRRGTYTAVSQQSHREQHTFSESAQCSVSGDTPACNSYSEVVLSLPELDIPTDGPECDKGDGHEPQEWKPSKTAGGWSAGWEPLFQRESWCMATGACFARQPRFEEA